MRPRPKPSRALWTSIAAISLSIATRTALAQNVEAETLFAEGDRLMNEGKLEAACEAFEASNRIEARAGTLIRLGDCRHKNKQLASAWSAYKDALARVKDPKKREVAQGKLAEIQPRLSYLTVTVGDTTRVDGQTVMRNGKPLDPALWNRAVPIDGGSYVIAVRAPGHAEWETTVVVPPELGNATVPIPKLDAVAVAVDVERQPDADDPPPRPTGSFTTRRKVAVGVAAAGVGAIVAGAILGSSAKSKETDAFAICPDAMTACPRADEANALLDAADSRALTANIAFAVGGAAVVGAGILWLTGSPETARVSIAPSRSSTSIVLVGRF